MECHTSIHLAISSYYAVAQDACRQQRGHFIKIELQLDCTIFLVVTDQGWMLSVAIFTTF